MNDDLVAAALLGTARRTPTFDTLEPVPRGVVEQLSTDDAAASLLEAAALERAYERGGVTSTTATPPTVCDDDPRYQLPAAAVARFRDLAAANSRIIDEWLVEALGRNYRAPDELVALVLRYAKASTNNQTYRDRLVQLASIRGQWLAAQNPEWSDFTSYTLADLQVWNYGTLRERAKWLTDVRRQDPDAALEQLTKTWPQEPGPARFQLIGSLLPQLNDNDTDFLEQALDDGRQEVRTVAAAMLAKLPDSPLSQRMSERIREWVYFDENNALSAKVPVELDDAAIRDGIGDRSVSAANDPMTWFGRVVRATPLAVWEQLLGPPATAVTSAIDERWKLRINVGWADAAKAQHNAEWAEALLRRAGVKDTDLIKVMPADAVADWVLADPRPLLDYSTIVLDALPHPWPREFAIRALELLMQMDPVATRPDDKAFRRQLHTHALAHLPIDLLGVVRGAADRAVDGGTARRMNQIAFHLIQRKTMLEELQ